MIDIIVKHGKHLYIKWKDRKKENETRLERNNNSNKITTKHEIFLLQGITMMIQEMTESYY